MKQSPIRDVTKCLNNLKLYKKFSFDVTLFPFGFAPVSSHNVPAKFHSYCTVTL